jgi:hypothetical protein
MCYFKWVHIAQSTQELFDNRLDNWLAVLFGLSQVGQNRATLTVLSHQIVRLVKIVDLENLNDIGMVQFFQHVKFLQVEGRVTLVPAFLSLALQDFDCSVLVGFEAKGFHDIAVGSLSDLAQKGIALLNVHLLDFDKIVGSDFYRVVNVLIWHYVVFGLCEKCLFLQLLNIQGVTDTGAFLFFCKMMGLVDVVVVFVLILAIKIDGGLELLINVNGVNLDEGKPSGGHDWTMDTFLELNSFEIVGGTVQAW